eukprot:COSAG06_NODE_3990_length_4681_cov_6.415481_1_plen_1011_part_00
MAVVAAAADNSICLPAAPPPIDIKQQCICRWTNTGTLLSCRELRQRHEFGGTTHRLPLEPVKAKRFMQEMEIPPDLWQDYIDCNTDPDGEEVRFAHIHMHSIDRRMTAGGWPKVINGTTNFRDDKRSLPSFGNPPLPSRPRRGQFGVEASPNKHDTPEAAAVAVERRKVAARQMRDLGGDGDDEDSQEPAAAPQPSGFRAGTGLATIEQVISLARDVEAHAQRCKGKINWSTRDSTFVGVVMSLGGYCRTCGKTARWYSSPACTDATNELIANPDAHVFDEAAGQEPGALPRASELYLNTLVPFALAVSPGITEQKLCLMEALELSIPDKSGLFKQMHGEIADAVSETWEDEQRSIMDVAKERHDGKMLLAVDGSHTGTADGAGTLSTVNAVDLIQNKVVWSECSNYGSPNGREHALGKKLLEWVKENDIDVPAIAIDESSLQSVIRATVRCAALDDDMTEAQCMEVIIDLVRLPCYACLCEPYLAHYALSMPGADLPLSQWHDKKNMKKELADWSSGVSKELNGMMVKIEHCATQQNLALTDAAITTVVGQVNTALHTQFRAEFLEFEDATDAMQSGATAVSTVEIARSQSDEEAQRSLLSKLHGAKGQHGSIGAMPATHRRANVPDAEIEALRQALHASRTGRGKGPVSTLSNWRWTESNGAAAPVMEMKMVIKALHSNGTVVAQVTSGSPTRTSLKQWVIECLPSATGAAGVTKSSAEIIAAVTEDVLADQLSSLNLPAAGDRDWEAWGQQQQPPRTLNAGDNNEEELIKKLTELEAQKPPGSRTRHPHFTRAALLEPHKLDGKQTAVVMAWLQEPRAGLNVTEERCAIEWCLPANASLRFRLALAEAGNLCDAEVPRYVQQYARLARAVNVSWGAASREWKAWWVLKGLQNLPKHACKNCTDCNRFLHFAQCGARDWRPTSLPRAAREHMWSDFTDSPTEVPNIAALASVLVNLFTIGAKMRKHSFNSVLFARTANNESLNNMYALWTTKATHSTVSACSLSRTSR